MKKNMKTVVKYIITPLIALSLLFGTAAAASYDPNVDYMELMIKAAIARDYKALEEAARLRNEKIKGENMSWTPVSAAELLETFEYRVGFSLDADYMAEMVAAVYSGDYNAGVEAAKKRNIKISYLGLGYQKFTFDDFVLLAKVIQNEAGSDWLPMEWRMGVGEVVLNRVASPAFPNTIYDVVYEPKQYADKQNYNGMVLYSYCIDAAVRLMNGERVFNDPSVLYQANFKQGYGVAMHLYHPLSGSTYFCYG